MKLMRRGGRMGRKKISIARISDERNRWAVKCHRIHCYCRFVIVSHFLDYKRTKESPFNCYQIITVIILCGKQTIYLITRGKQPKLCNDWWLVGFCTRENCQSSTIIDIDNHHTIWSNPNTELTRQRKTWVAKVSKDIKTFDSIWKHMATAKECWVINIRTMFLWIKTQHSWTKPKTKLSRFPNKCQHKKNVAPSAQFSLQWTLVLSTFNFMQHLYHRQLKYLIHYIYSSTQAGDFHKKKVWPHEESLWALRPLRLRNFRQCLF